METRIVEDRYICEVRETSRYGNGCIKNRFQTNICRLTPYSLTLNAWNCRILGVFILCASVDCLFRFSINHIRRTLLKKWGVMLNLQFTTKDAKNLIKWSIFLKNGCLSHILRYQVEQRSRGFGKFWKVFKRQALRDGKTGGKEEKRSEREQCSNQRGESGTEREEDRQNKDPKQWWDDCATKQL